MYTNLYDITAIQQKIVRYISYWVKVENTPIPQKEIMEEMLRRGERTRTVEHALGGLLKLGYIRKSVETSNQTKYVQLKNI